ncbi:MAG: PAS domain S-box protein [Deltaproteobacteria bacterium]|nr:PAS domain S-box protein [Deltaproteobacteria bacterium]
MRPARNHGRRVAEKKRPTDGDATPQEPAAPYSRSLIEAIRDPLVIISPEGKISDVNETSIKATGVPREKLIGTDFSDCFTDPQKARDGYQQVFAKGFVTEYPLTLRCKDGSLIDVVYNASLYKGAEGNVVGVVATLRDVTESRRAEEKFRALLEFSPDAIVIVGKDGLIAIANVQTEKVFGYNRNELLGQPIEILIPDRYRSRHPDHRAGFLKEPRSRPMGAGLELFGVRKDGTEFPVEISLNPLATSEGMLVSSIIRDVSVQKRLAAEIAEQRNKELERLAELERFQRLTVGRELKMIELKKEIEELKKKVGKE